MDRARFETIAADEFAKIPQHFSRKIENVALLIEDEPSEDVRQAEGLSPEETLLGLYHGIPFAERGSGYGAPGTLPDTITLFYRPLLEEAEMLLEEKRAPDFEGAVQLAVRETLWHEVGHYFGLGEEAVHAREDAQTNYFGAKSGYAQAPHADAEVKTPGAMLSGAPHQDRGRTVIRLRLSMAKKLAIIFGAIFVLVGLLGFVPNSFVGAGGIFATNTAHDLVHIVIGLVLLAVAFWATAQSALWLKVIGVLYLLVALLGFVMTSPLLGIIEVNSADNWLHVVLGVVLFLAGWWSHEDMMGAGMPSMPGTGPMSGPKPSM